MNQKREGMLQNILTDLDFTMTQRRMAVELLELLVPDEPILLIGIEKNGLPLALKMQMHLKEQNHQLDILVVGLKLDKHQPEEGAMRELSSMNISGRQVVLVDDVLNTGRTAMASIAAIVLQKPSSLRLAVLIDRMHKCYPVAADIAGARISTLKGQFVQVELDNGIPVVMLKG
ncbi:MAG: phosphoribosyltransferase family protein [Bacteroidetes bacterium]|nr:phosphoribosyltransferase family protein [Bacteroidota bacterium]